VFDLGWIHDDIKPPKNWKPEVYQAWDLAGTKKDLEDKGCESVGVALAQDWMSRWWLLDVVRGKWNTGELVEQILSFAWKHKAFRVWGEDPIALWLEDNIRRRCRESGRHIPFHRVNVQGRGDKVARAQAAIVPVMANGSFYVDASAPWYPGVRRDFSAFPGSRQGLRRRAVARLRRSHGHRAPVVGAAGARRRGRPAVMRGEHAEGIPEAALDRDHRQDPKETRMVDPAQLIQPPRIRSKRLAAMEAGLFDAINALSAALGAGKLQGWLTGALPRIGAFVELIFPPKAPARGRAEPVEAGAGEQPTRRARARRRDPAPAADAREPEPRRPPGLLQAGAREPRAAEVADREAALGAGEELMWLWRLAQIVVQAQRASDSGTSAQRSLRESAELDERSILDALMKDFARRYHSAPPGSPVGIAVPKGMKLQVIADRGAEALPEPGGVPMNEQAPTSYVPPLRFAIRWCVDVAHGAAVLPETVATIAQVAPDRAAAYCSILVAGKALQPAEPGPGFVTGPSWSTWLASRCKTRPKTTGTAGDEMNELRRVVCNNLRTAARRLKGWTPDRSRATRRGQPRLRLPRRALLRTAAGDRAAAARSNPGHDHRATRCTERFLGEPPPLSDRPGTLAGTPAATPELHVPARFLLALCEALATASAATQPMLASKNSRFLSPTLLRIERAGTTGGGTVWAAKLNGRGNTNRNDFLGDGASTTFQTDIAYRGAVEQQLDREDRPLDPHGHRRVTAGSGDRHRHHHRVRHRARGRQGDPRQRREEGRSPRSPARPRSPSTRNYVAAAPASSSTWSTTSSSRPPTSPSRTSAASR
jgi:predicted phage terminase large subunit-like protein